MSRSIDWAAWLNRLTFCYGCGRFGYPQPGGKPPKHWKVLYQPHPEGRPGLHVCSPDCDEKVRQAMSEGAVIEPLEIRPPPMPHELQEQMRQLVKGVAEEDLRARESEALVRIQGAVDNALIAAMEAKDGEPLTKREAIDVAANTIIDMHGCMGMAVTANVEIDGDGIATAEVVVLGKRPQPSLGQHQDHPMLTDAAHQEMVDLPISMLPTPKSEEGPLELHVLKRRKPLGDKIPPLSKAFPRFDVDGTVDDEDDEVVHTREVEFEAREHSFQPRLVEDDEEKQDGEADG